MNTRNEKLLFAAIADDDTGASDLAGMLKEQGVETLLVIDLPNEAQFLEWSRGYQAIVLAVGTRSVAPELARQRTRAAIALLQIRQPQQFFIKYCSTFDSTPAGNIGPTIDAALTALDEEFTVAVPALPVNGRTTYQGHHFVHEQLLSDSPLRHHPLNPMTNANLVEWLSLQTQRKVGLAPYQIVAAGADQLRAHFTGLQERGISIAIVDCLDDSHLQTIAEATAELRLSTGGSGLGITLPDVWRKRGWLKNNGVALIENGRPHDTGGCLLIAGSCSPATRKQNAYLAAQGAKVFQLDPLALATGELKAESIASRVIEELVAGRDCLLTTSSSPAEVQAMQTWGAARGLDAVAVGEAILRTLSAIALRIVESDAPRGLVVAGGETSGAICRQLELGAFRIGGNIDPGVPLCYSLGKFKLPVALKSGNFGAPDFYQKAAKAISRWKEYLQ
jgi:uncharacterized protein YgbK (DUF1537 family)